MRERHVRQIGGNDADQSAVAQARHIGAVVGFVSDRGTRDGQRFGADVCAQAGGLAQAVVDSFCARNRIDSGDSFGRAHVFVGKGTCLRERHVGQIGGNDADQAAVAQGGCKRTVVGFVSDRGTRDSQRFGADVCAQACGLRQAVVICFSARDRVGSRDGFASAHVFVGKGTCLREVHVGHIGGNQTDQAAVVQARHIGAVVGFVSHCSTSHSQRFGADVSAQACGLRQAVVARFSTCDRVGSGNGFGSAHVFVGKGACLRERHVGCVCADDADQSATTQRGHS